MQEGVTPFHGGLVYYPEKNSDYMQNFAIWCICGQKMDHFDQPSTTLFWTIQTNLHNVTNFSSTLIKNKASIASDRQTDLCIS